jgi:ABC-type sugar transport system ATPase subunit
MTTQLAQSIHVQGLEKSYKKLEVLHGVDFDVARGSIFALLGANRAGKTTVVNILSTLLKADAGTASINGFDVATQAADVRESISLTGQFAAVDELLTGRENLVLVARLRHLKEAGQIADDLAWLAVAGILILFSLALTWIAVIPGLSAKSADGASAFSYPLIFLPFISSAFVPTDTMPGPVRAFAEYQPMTPIVNTIRDLYTQQPISTDIWIALAWCVGILIVAYTFAMVIYRRRIS